MFRFIKPFLDFVKAYASDFKRVAKATRHDVPVEDLQQDAFIKADDIGGRRGKPIDFSDRTDQELIMRAVNLENVRRGDWHLRRSIRVDRGEGRAQSLNHALSPKWIPKKN